MNFFPKDREEHGNHEKQGNQNKQKFLCLLLFHLQFTKTQYL